MADTDIEQTADAAAQDLPTTLGESRRATAGSLGLCGDLPRIDRGDRVRVEYAGQTWTGTLEEALEVGAIVRVD